MFLLLLWVFPAVEMLVCLLLLHVVTLFCVVNGDNVMEDYLGDTLAVTSTPATTQNKMSRQCDHCSKTPPGLHTTDRTTQGPPEYIVNDISGICLIMKANIMVALNFTKMRRNITITSHPITEIIGDCYDDIAYLELNFPNGQLDLRFIQNQNDSLFYLYHVDLYMESEVFDAVYASSSLVLKAFVTPLGHSFTCDEVILRMTPNVTLILMDVSVQAFQLEGNNSERDYGKKSDSCDHLSHTLAVTPRSASTQNIMGQQCDHCPKNPPKPHTTDRSSVPHTAYTTQGLSTAPLPPEYIVKGTSGVCLRIKANFMVTVNSTKMMRNITIPPPPITEIYENCDENEAKLWLEFPMGDLSMTFIKNGSLFYLNGTYLYIHSEDVIYTSSSLALKAFVTPLGHSFICKEVILRMTPNVTLILMDITVQAFQLEGDNSKTDYGSNSDSCGKESEIIIYGKKFIIQCNLLKLLLF
ncbi:uncharacterized protein [Pyxicephalus adspersus]|uniref:uncharacterized protein isoform X3 n=1 Tax=Pyxicephalus adspersus TaxID=30357 RepID=UPI003B59C8A8